MRREDRSASYKAFYQWGERDFISIPAYELEKGDEIAYLYGGDLKYGALTYGVGSLHKSDQHLDDLRPSAG